MTVILTELKRYLEKGRVSILIRLSVSSVILIYLYYKLNWRALELIDGSILLYFISSLPIPILSLLIMATRWKMLIESILNKKVDIMCLYKFYYISSFFSLFLPGSIGGDATRIYNSKEKYNINLKYAAAFVLIERIMGLTGVILIFSLGSMMIPETASFKSLNILTYILIFLILTLLLFKDRLLGKSEFLINNKLIIFLILLSMVAQFGDIFIVKLLSIYFNLTVTIPQLMVIMPIIYIVSNLPISLGGLGIREATMVALFSSFGFDASISVLISLFLYLTKIFIGLIGMIIYIKKDT